MFVLRSLLIAILSSAVLAACSGGGGERTIPAQPLSNLSSAGAASNAEFDPLTAAAYSVRSLSSPSYKGCSIFASGGYYNSDVSSAATDAHSNNYLASLMATDNTGFYGSAGIEPVNIASTSTALYQVRQQVSWHPFPVRYPWSSSFKIEPSGDAHSIVVLAHPPACHLYEAYATSFRDNVLSAYSGANWDLSQPYQVVSGSSMASGLSLFAGSVRHEEIATGIHHALDLKVFSNALCNCYTAPASGTDGVAYKGPSTSYQMPYGAHLRLKASFSESGYGTQSRAILEALKHYGGYIADTGGHYTNNNGVYLVDPTDGGSWDSSDLSGLRNLRFSNFDVLKISGVTNR